MSGQDSLLKKPAFWLGVAGAAVGLYFIFQKTAKKRTPRDQISEFAKERVQIDELFKTKCQELIPQEDATGRAYSAETVHKIDEVILLSSPQEFLRMLQNLRTMRRAYFEKKPAAYIQTAMDMMIVLTQTVGRNNLDQVLQRVGLEQGKYLEGLAKIPEEEVAERRINVIVEMIGNLKGKILDSSTFKEVLTFQVQICQAILAKIGSMKPEEILIQPYIIEDQTFLKYKIENEDILETMREAVRSNSTELYPAILDYIAASEKLENKLQELSFAQLIDDMMSRPSLSRPIFLKLN